MPEEKIPTLIEKLATVQEALKVPKGNRNTHGDYNYRTCGDILEAVKPLLKTVGAGLVLTDELVLIGDRYYIKATATIYDFDKNFPDLSGGGSMSVTAFARECLTRKGMDESQITGASSSYARKYALNGLFCIDDTADADSMDNSKIGTTNNGSPRKPRVTHPNGNQQGELLRLADLVGADINKTLAHFNVSDIKDLTMEQYKKIHQKYTTALAAEADADAKTSEDSTEHPR